MLGGDDACRVGTVCGVANIANRLTAFGHYGPVGLDGQALQRVQHHAVDLAVSRNKKCERWQPESQLDGAAEPQFLSVRSVKSEVSERQLVSCSSSVAVGCSQAVAVRSVAVNDRLHHQSPASRTTVQLSPVHRARLSDAAPQPNRLPVQLLRPPAPVRRAHAQ